MHLNPSLLLQRYLFPRQVTANGIGENDVEISNAAIEHLCLRYTREAGVRQLEREIGAVCRHVAVKVVAWKQKDQVEDLDGDEDDAETTGEKGATEKKRFTPFIHAPP